MTQQSRSDTLEAARKAASERPSEPDDSRALPGGLGLVVGIGASAGGLNAFKAFLKSMPAESGMSFVLVQHLAPDHKSMLTDLLGQATGMRVLEAEDGVMAAADTVYVIPPDATLILRDRRLRVTKPAPPRALRRPIDTFFTSLAEDQGENAVCIVLAGTGNDGALGLSAVKENGGLTLAQAEFDHIAMSGMPQSATATGFVDEVMPVEQMPARLLDHQRHLSLVAPRKDDDGTRRDAAGHLVTISALLRAQIGHDFVHYKEKTLVRRVQRRMQVLQIDEVPAYIARLRDDPGQIDLLFRELLIGVTQFFRDPEAFQALQAALAPKFAGDQHDDDTIRIWVPGCATGEEVYSLAILVREIIAQRPSAVRVQIFGTDIDTPAIAFARQARYRKTIGLTPERLAKWFSPDGDAYCPVKVIREMCVFSTHSVTKDPPFSKLDLISCRNLLIYMNAALQDRVMKTFHYALKPDGMLFLGPSESMTRQSRLFADSDKKHRIFRREDTVATLPDVTLRAASFATPDLPPAGLAAGPGEDRIDKTARRLLEKYSPAFVVIDKHNDILRFSGGEAGHYLEPSSGVASLNLFGILRKALRPIVRSTLQQALSKKAAAVHEAVPVRIDGQIRAVTVIVEPLTEGGLCVVAFRDDGIRVVSRSRKASIANEAAATAAMEHELLTARMQLQATVDELETTNEERRAAAEEYQSANEELQSSNEELETSKEEMQSINEELQTVNAEVVSKNEALTHLNSDLKNLLDSTEIATSFLDSNLRIKSFTPKMTDIFHLRDSDRGRPITDITSMLGYDEIEDDARQVLRELSVVEREVQIKHHGMSFLMRMRPYRTMDNVVDGVVITFMDINERKKAEETQDLLVRELNHRIKNLFAVTNGVVSLSARSAGTPQEMARAIRGRLEALARAHELIIPALGGSGEAFKRGTTLDALVMAIASPYREQEGDRERVTIDGPSVPLGGQAVTSLALVLHELATNATKYGALSSSKGHIAISWTISEGALALIWEERGGPTVAGPPLGQGFGSLLVRRSIEGQLAGVLAYDWKAEGLIVRLSTPMERLLQ
ncbi:two-component system CheB/CheR fusion protein [Bosea sp. BE125]|uniref:chemotaxis protein CheB n=1 Tax=Bosea sp. BE125 TaxID=2817909 RepID=UPI002854408A|nr:chemotaxis protein CheB [Bosea sp. BE125]MDR6874515.1 two-component system CheB/CheR fusion protein [Bosea sp. BE125]